MILNEQEGELDELEKTVEPTWPKLVEPLEKIVDKLTVVWGMVNHLKAVQDSTELRSAIEEVQVSLSLSPFWKITARCLQDEILKNYAWCFYAALL